MEKQLRGTCRTSVSPYPAWLWGELTPACSFAPFRTGDPQFQGSHAVVTSSAGERTPKMLTTMWKERCLHGCG